MSFHEQILDIATSRDWMLLGINLLVSTLVGGIVIIVLLSILSRVWKEQLKVSNAFLMVFLINIINIFGITALVSFLPGIILLLVPLLIWIGFTKVFFPELSLIHTAIA